MAYNPAMLTSLTKRNLFSILVVLGILNITLAYGLFYLSSISLLEERSRQQMESVRSLASQKLSLYLTSLKFLAREASSDGKSPELPFELRDSVINVFKTQRNDSRPVSEFIHEGDKFLLKLPGKNEQLIWVFSYNGLSELLAQYVGMGQTGEIYLVGKEGKILSASRHLKESGHLVVKNESLKQGNRGVSGVHVVDDYRGVEVVSAFAPFTFDQLNFIILSEIDREEVLRPMRSLFPKVFIICFLLSLIALIMAYFATFKIFNLIEAMGQELKSVHMKFITATEEEKRRISYNLHDGVGQILTALKWGISRTGGNQELKALCDEAFQEIRSISDDLMPAALSEFGFFSAIKNFISKQEVFYKIKINYWFSEQLLQFKFKEGLDINLYRMVQELLQNTIKHASAQTISIVLLKEDDSLLLRYEDDGVGMQDQEPMPKVLSYRSDLMGASLTRTKSASGLVFELKVPLKRIFYGIV